MFENIIELFKFLNKINISAFLVDRPRNCRVKVNYVFQTGKICEI